MKKNKKELIEEANKIAEECNFKKGVIEKMLNDLDSKKTLTEEHLTTMSVIEEIMKEIDDLLLKHAEVVNQIKGS